MMRSLDTQEEEGNAPKLLRTQQVLANLPDHNLSTGENVVSPSYWNEEWNKKDIIFNSEQDNINEIVCSTAREVYQKINANWIYPTGADCELLSTSEFWTGAWIKQECLVLGKSSERNLPTLILKTSPENILEALDDLINKPAELDCTIALETVQVFCIRNLLGDYNFKKYATTFYDNLNRTRSKPIHLFFRNLSKSFMHKEEGEAKPGSMVYITNISAYKTFKPNSVAQGFNVICVGNNQYMGFDSIYEDGPLPLEAIEEHALELFKYPVDVEQDHNAHEFVCKRLTKENFTEIRRKEQMKKYSFREIFNVQYIEDFYKTSSMQ